MAGALPKERRNLLSQLVFRLSRNGSCPQSCPQPSVVSTMMGGAILHTGPRLDGQQTPQSLQTPPISPGAQAAKPGLCPFHLLALRRSVNPPKPTNPTNLPGLRVCESAPLLFSQARVSSEKNPSKPTKPYQATPPGWHTDTVFNYSFLAMASGLHGIHAQTNPRKNLSGSLPPAQ